MIYPHLRNLPPKNAEKPSMRSNEMQATHTEKLWNKTNTKKKKHPGELELHCLKTKHS